MAPNLLNRIRNLVQKVALSRRKDGDALEIQTAFGRGYTLRELKPYGLASKPDGGKGICLFVGGDTRSPVLLPIDDRKGQPDLEDGEVALYHSAGHCVVLRKNGNVELNGNNMGGLVKWGELQSQLDKVTQILQGLQNSLTSQVPEPGNGSPSAFQTVLKGLIGQLQLPNYQQVENEKVQHGEGPP